MTEADKNPAMWHDLEQFAAAVAEMPITEMPQVLGRLRELEAIAMARLCPGVSRSPLNFNCEELGWMLVMHFQEHQYPIMGQVVVAVAAAEAVKKASEIWQCTPLEAAERIKAKQEAWLKSTPGNSDTPKPARWWYRDGYWLNTPAEWERREANLKSRENELETESEHKGEEVPER